ncbi:MAG: GspH/FimT family protein [Candidatus Rokuibacteriota bacterium]|jgi:prepilin-type N-terminal cleavage/methylation domain-containing protein
MKARGFTLMETAVVLLVLSLAAALAAPPVARGLDAIRLRAEVAGVASFLRGARERAISQHRAIEVSIDGEGRALVLRGGEGEPARGGDVASAVRHLAPEVHVTAEPPPARTVTFFAHGLSSGGRFRIEARQAVVYIVVDPLTGRVSTRRGGES